MKPKKPEIDIIEYRAMCKMRGYSSRRLSHRFNKDKIVRLNAIKKTIYGCGIESLNTKQHQSQKARSEN